MSERFVRLMQYEDYFRLDIHLKDLEIPIIFFYFFDIQNAFKCHFFKKKVLKKCE